MADITTDKTARAYQKAQDAEYGTYVCADPEGIRIDGVRAFNEGDPVPVSHVEAYPDLLNQGLVKERPKAKKNVQPGQPGQPPAGNATREEWAAYATAKGATGDELKEPSEGGLSRDELRAKYGA